MATCDLETRPLPQGFGLPTARVGPLAAAAPQNPAPWAGPAEASVRLRLRWVSTVDVWKSQATYLYCPSGRTLSVPALESCVLCLNLLLTGLWERLALRLYSCSRRRAQTPTGCGHRHGDLSRAQKCQSVCRPHGCQGPPVTWEQRRGSAVCGEGQRGCCWAEGGWRGLEKGALWLLVGAPSVCCVPQAVSAA